MSVSDQEHIVVVGAGLEGCLTTIKLAQAGYRVTLFEAQDQILNGASIIASRLHLGGEYPLDEKTALDCVKGAMIWKMVMPDDIYTNQPGMRFTVAEKTQAEGKLTVESHQKAYENVRLGYEGLLNSYLACTTREGRAATPAEREKAEKIFFGPAGKGVFSRPLTSEELAPYQGIAGGFQSQEPGLDVPLYLSVIESELLKLQKQGRIEIKTGHAAKAVIPTEDGYAIGCETEKDGAKHTRRYKADQVVLAAWDGGPELDMPYRRPDEETGKVQEVTVYHRAMALVDTSGLPADSVPPPTFVMLGERDGAMISPLNRNLALAYKPGKKTSYLGEMVMTALDAVIPDKWKANILHLGPLDWVKRLVDFHALLTMVGVPLKEQDAGQAGTFASMRDARFGAMVVRNTMNFDREIERRRHEPVQELAPGLFTSYPTKVTLAPQSVIETVESVKARSRLGKQTEDKQAIPLPPIDAFAIAASGAYKIRRKIGARDEIEAVRFAEARKLPTAGTRYYDDITISTYIPTPSDGRSSDALITTETTTRSNLSIGQGFGDRRHVSVYTQAGPRTGPLLSPASLGKLREWLKDDAAPLGAAGMPIEEMSAAVHSRLAHMDRLEAMELLPAMLRTLPSQARAMLFDGDRLARLPESLWRDIVQARPLSRLLEEASPDMLEFYFLQLFSEGGKDLSAPLGQETESRTHSNPPIPLASTPAMRSEQTIAMEVACVILPILYANLSPAERNAVTESWLDSLHAKPAADPSRSKRLLQGFFEPMLDPDFNRVTVTKPQRPSWVQTIHDNGKAVQIRAGQNGRSASKGERGPAVSFQGQRYEAASLYLRRTRNLGEGADAQGLPRLLPIPQAGQGTASANEPLFKIYESPEHEAACLAGVQPDPNERHCGELLGEFTATDPVSGHRRALTLAAPIQLDPDDRDNAGIERYLAHLRRALNGQSLRGRPLIAGESDWERLLFNLFGCYNRTPAKTGGFERNDLPESHIVSLQLGDIQRMGNGAMDLTSQGNDILTRGMTVIHRPEPVTISRAQLRELETLQPDLLRLDPQYHAFPINQAVPASGLVP